MFWLNNSSWHLKKQSIFEMLSLPHRRIPKMQCNITTSLIVSLYYEGGCDCGNGSRATVAPLTEQTQGEQRNGTDFYLPRQSRR